MISKRKIRKEVGSVGENYAEKNHVHPQYATHDEVNSSNGNGSPNSYTHPSSHPPSIIDQDTANRFVTDAEKTNWGTAYTHSQSAHAPSNAEANNISDVNAAALTGGGETSLHSHPAGAGGLSHAQVLTRSLGC